jgi:DNA-binding transcriptional LysR family regulator
LTARVASHFLSYMQLRGVDTNLIVALHALLQHQNVTRAAKDVGLGQSSMSHALSRLRIQFEDPLLVPVGRRLELTDRAKHLVVPVMNAVAQLDRVFARLERFDPRTSQRSFRIAATDNLELYVLPGLSARLQQTAPNIDLRVSALSPDWTNALQRGDIDLKLGRKYATTGLLRSQDLTQESFACVARRGHPISKKPSLEEFAAWAHLLVSPTAPPAADPGGVVDVALARHGLRRRVAMTVPHFLVAPFVVASSDLLLTAPARSLAPFVKSLSLRRIELPIKVPSYRLSQVWATRMDEDDAHRWLRGEISRLLKPTE